MQTHPPHVTPYDTGKVKIGSMYLPPRPAIEMSQHAELLQIALLSKPLTLIDRWRMWLDSAP